MTHRTEARTALAVLLAGLAIAAAGCDASGPEAGAAGPPATPAPSVTAAPSDPAAPSAPAPAAPAPSEPSADPVASPVTPPSPGTGRPAADQPTEDGSWHAVVVEAAPAAVVLDKVEVLSGEAADSARREDGRPDPGAEAPYVRNRNRQLRTLPVTDDVAVQVVDCSNGGCGSVPWPYADLVAGRPLPYGAPSIPFTVTVVDGRVVALAEVYLP
jgi:hypothetical protein